MDTYRANKTGPVTEPVFITPRQLSERWQCSVEKLKRMRRAGRLPVSYLGRSARYRVADVLRIEAEASVQ